MYIYGKNVVYAKLKSDDLIKEAFVFKKFSDQEIIDLLKMKKIDIKWVDKYQLDKMVNGLHQGIILTVNQTKILPISTYPSHKHLLHNLHILINHISLVHKQRKNHLLQYPY